MTSNNGISPRGIVITGAPASGKSLFLKRLMLEPCCEDFVFIGEIARRLLEDNPSYRQNWGEFHNEVYRLQVEAEKAAEGNIFVSDRGTVDAFSFHPETAAQMGTSIETEYERYFAVIQLGSSAVLGQPYYRTDEIRTETEAEALAFELATTRVWKAHPRYYYVPAEIDIEKKYRTFLVIIEKIILELTEGRQNR
ncbi:MAG TPA: AAA family ATPase [candidate division Zixibacteria bacterium]|nr:AAA family ATPase [candidate division Zixibacteria bacterium]